MPAGQVRPRRIVMAFVLTVCLAAVVVNALIVGLTTRDGAWQVRAAAWVLGALVCLPEMRPIRATSEENSLTMSVSRSAFTLALCLIGPLGFALAATAVGDVSSALIRRAKPFRTLFNVAQESLSLTVGGLTFGLIHHQALLAGGRPFDASALPAALAAATIYYLANHALVAAVIALDQRYPFWQSFGNGFWFGVASSGVLYVFAPGIVAGMQVSPWFVVPMLMPVLAVRRGATLAADRERQALHDPLTGLPNRALLRDRMSRLLLDPGRCDRPVGLLLMDLDHFKDINDTLGHHVGDLLLRDVGERMRSVVREADTVARLGGDEFAVLLGGLDDGNDAVAVAERLQHVMREPFAIAGVMLDVQVSTGIAFSPEHGTDIDTLLQRADVALYAAKATRGCWAVYRPEDDSHSVERLALLGELRVAIETGQLTVHYQPKADALSGEVIGLEALVRWDHPTLGILPPDRFVPLAESTGLIGELTVDVLRRALAQTAAWRSAGSDLEIAVNISAKLLTDLSLPLDVAALLADFAIPASALTLEVTETMILADPTRTIAVLHGLAEVGVSLSIDDFGTGYSSLSYLRRLHADELKIDRSFIQAMTPGSNEEVIVRSTIELARSLGLRTVAEGVETAEAWQLLRDLGCDQIQGYHLARPMPAAEVLPWLANYRREAPIPHQGEGPAPRAARRCEAPAP